MAQRPRPEALSKTNMFVSGLPFNITEEQVRAMFAEFGIIKSILIKSPLRPPNEVVKNFSPIIASEMQVQAYINFDTEDAARASLAMNTRDPMSSIKVAYYDKKNQMRITNNEADVRNNVNYRILFLSKLNRKVSHIFETPSNSGNSLIRQSCLSMK